MTEEAFKERTRRFAIDVLELAKRTPRGLTADILLRQLVRCATSVGANYRAACQGRSDAEMAAKLNIVVEEANECLYWLDLLAAGGFCEHDTCDELAKEANELLSMAYASVKTLRARIGKYVRESGVDLYFSEGDP